MLDKKTKQKFLRFVGMYLLYYVLVLLIKTLRVETRNSESIEKNLKEKKNFVLAFWHGTMLLPWYYHRNKNFSALVSQSKDGEILTRLLKRWNYSVVRGSSNMGGKEALELLMRESSEGRNIAITPDGPKGPIYEMKAGAVVCAKKNSIPLYLLGARYDKKYILKSWDKFEIPKPFSKVSLVYSDPKFIDPGADYDTTSALIKEYEKELFSLQNMDNKAC